MKQKIETYRAAAGGWDAVKAVAGALRQQMDLRREVIAMFDMNKPDGFDCPGCAWPDPKHSASFDVCENGAKALAWEVTDKRLDAPFFTAHTVQSLLSWDDHALEAAGRLTLPLKYDAASDRYLPLSWQQAFDEIGARLQGYSDPNQVEFYTSGRTSNEAAFLYQLFAREYGSNNFPDCSNMCHEPTSVGLAASIGVGKGTVLLEDFEQCDLVICIGHNPGTNHPPHVDLTAGLGEAWGEDDRHQPPTGARSGTIHRAAEPAGDVDGCRDPVGQRLLPGAHRRRYGVAQGDDAFIDRAR
ncbi:Formate dehydrogenase H [Edwardsiella tarda]|nr:Formate dehydrogenase H [Edwardsiella tarda]